VAVPYYNVYDTSFGAHILATMPGIVTGEVEGAVLEVDKPAFLA
jgi:hypothetical protein